MKISDLLQFDQVVIQCHDNPDADAIASGWGVFRFLQRHGKAARLIYGGGNEIQKANLALMVKALDIPIQHITELPKEPELLLCVDCQYGEKNVQRFAARQVAVIDHHRVGQSGLPELSEVRENYGSCSTIVWDMLEQAGWSVKEDQDLATALYYGLFTDTVKLQELRHPKDMDLRDELMLCCRRDLLFQLQNCNLSWAELGLTGRALSGCHSYPEYRFALAEVERCDPNILGVISDMMMETDTVDVCVAYCVQGGGAKLSVRSCVGETRANDLAAWLAGGGGHARKAGGFLKSADIPEGQSVYQVLEQRALRYFREQEIYDVKGGKLPDLSNEPVYRKRRLPIGYVKAAELYPVGAQVSVRMLEGDLTCRVEADTYFMIGVESEVYLNTEAYLLSHNDLTNVPYVFRGEYAPQVREAVSALDPELEPRAAKSLCDHVSVCIPREEPLAHARRLERLTKVFVPWSGEYLLGLPGDWLVARVDDPEDVYIVKADIFEKSYSLKD